MHLLNGVTDEVLLTIQLKGSHRVAPEEAREFLNLLAKSGLSDFVVVKVGTSDEWVKLASRWGAALRYGMRDSRDEQVAQAQKGVQR